MSSPVIVRLMRAAGTLAHLADSLQGRGIELALQEVGHQGAAGAQAAVADGVHRRVAQGVAGGRVIWCACVSSL